MTPPKSLWLAPGTPPNRSHSPLAPLDRLETGLFPRPTCKTGQKTVALPQLCAILKSAQLGRFGGVFSLGRDSSTRRRTSRKRAAPLQTQGSDRRHHQGSQASFLLSEARREEACKGSACSQAQSQEDPQGTGLACSFNPGWPPLPNGSWRPPQIAPPTPTSPGQQAPASGCTLSFRRQTNMSSPHDTGPESPTTSLADRPSRVYADRGRSVFRNQWEKRYGIR